MDEFSAIADDLSVWEHHAPSYASRSHRVAQPSPVAPAIGRLQIDLQHLAVLVCVMASAANALEKQSENHALIAMIIDFCPKQPFDAASKVESIADLETADQIIEALQDFQARLTFAQMLTKHLDGQFRAAATGKQGNLEILADAWRRTSTNLLAVLSSLKEAGRTNAEDADNSTLVLGFLKNCIAGGTPCLTPEGQLEIPGWAERRSAARITVQKHAQASTGGDYFDVAVLNASTIGLGLTGDVASGQHTTVVFDDGRKVSGTVKWSEEGRFGLQLDQPLSKTDRLLAVAPSSY